MPSNTSTRPQRIRDIRQLMWSHLCELLAQEGFEIDGYEQDEIDEAMNTVLDTMQAKATSRTAR